MLTLVVSLVVNVVQVVDPVGMLVVPALAG
jgi:hypothetical protein